MGNHLAIGMLAHVDAGKTTLAEGLLFEGGCLGRLGRVDHRDAFLDTDEMERRRGITIFSKQAVLPLEQMTLTLLDTPGHVDFSAEMERTLQILDYGILVISGSDGVQGHTLTLWQLLHRYRIPTFLFVNKMDLPGTDAAALLEELQARLDPGCIAFSGRPDAQSLEEEIALLEEEALSQFLDRGHLEDNTVRSLIGQRLLFPCYFGAALRLEGVGELLEGLKRYARPPDSPQEFGAAAYKISRDPQNNRLTHLKITGGSLGVRSPLTGRFLKEPEESWTEKVTQIRIYSGEKYQTVEEALPGAICAVTGLSHTYPGQGLGEHRDAPSPTLEPALSFRILLPPGQDPHSAFRQLSPLEEENPQLSITWAEASQEIHLRLMGEVQLDMLRHLIGQRFGLEVDFDEGQILYRETIAEAVVGMGHFEPLRHYAEVHLLLEPAPRGSGLSFASACSEDILPRHWQRLILSHLEEGEYPGVLTGAPITDLNITLLTGKGHTTHTQGGDFRQATYRALRQGLMQAKSLLLEPWYQFRLEVPSESVGRAMTDLQRMTDDLSLPESRGDSTILTGSAPVAALRNYASEVTAYTRGMGRLFCTLKGFAACPHPEDIIATIGYRPLEDMRYPADSIFCSHGAGVSVPWNEAGERMHLDSGHPLTRTKPEEPSAGLSVPAGGAKGQDVFQLDKELQAIFEQTYGPIKRRDVLPRPPRPPKNTAESASKGKTLPVYDGPEYLLVDGYNIIHAWEDLKTVAQDNMDAARQMLMDILSNYRGFSQREIILVFDAYKVPGGLGQVSQYHNISVVYTKEAETADAYIEKVTYQMGKKHRVSVATSDGTVQLIIFGHGALRITPQALREEIESTNAAIQAMLQTGKAPKFTPTILLPKEDAPT